MERGAGTGIGGKLRSGSAFRKTEEAEGRTRGRQEDPLMTGEKVPQEKEDPGCKYGHRKEPRARGEPIPGRTRKDAREEI